MDHLISLMGLSQGCKGGLENGGQRAMRGIHPTVGTREGLLEEVSTGLGLVRGTGLIRKEWSAQ